MEFIDFQGSYDMKMNSVINIQIDMASRSTLRFVAK